MQYNINLNDMIKVKLTDLGVGVLRKRYKNLHSKLQKGSMNFINFELNLDGDDYHESQLRIPASIFNKCLTIGTRPVFEDDNLFLKKVKPL